MLNSFRVAFLTLLIVVVSLVAALDQPEWAHDLGLETWSWTALRQELCRLQDSPYDKPTLDLPALERRYEVRNRIIAELFEGRLTLFEAAALFRRNEGTPTSKSFPYYLDRSEEERLCFQVILWAQAVLRERHSDAVDEVGARLEEELRQHKERHGRVLLPDMADEPTVPAVSFPIQ